MGNHCSSKQYVDRDAALRDLWKSQRAIPVLPINPYLDALRVLNRQSDGFHDIGSVYSLCKPGEDKEWLKEVLLPRRRLHHLLPATSTGEQRSVVLDDDGALAQALVGPANAAAWLQNAESIQICIPDCEIRELHMDNWAELIRRFDPKLQTLGPPGRNGKRDLFIVQKVLLVSHVKITASYQTDDASLELATSADHPVTPSPGVTLEASFRPTSSGSVVGEFTLSPAHRNLKLPVAFSGFLYTYDKFGNRDLDGKETRSQADAAGEVGESSGAASDDGSEAEDEEEGAQIDEHMGGFLVDNVFATIIPGDLRELEILPHLEEEEEEAEHADAEENEGQVHVVDQNASDLEDID
jgi:hypothetical protein